MAIKIAICKALISVNRKMYYTIKFNNFLLKYIKIKKCYFEKKKETNNDKLFK